MGLKISISEMSSRISSINAKLKNINSDINKIITNMKSYISEEKLSGKAYNNSKSYLEKMYLPILNSVILANQSIISSNNSFVGLFNSYVVNPEGFETDTDILEEMIAKLEQQNRSYENQLSKLKFFGNVGEFLSNINPWKDSIREKIKLNQEKIEKIKKVIKGMYDFNSNCAGIYKESFNIFNYINKGLNDIEFNNWDSKTNMFNISFVEKLNYNQLKNLKQKTKQLLINSKYKYVPVQFSGKTYKILTEIPVDLDIMKGTKSIKSQNDVIFDLGVFISGFSFNDEKPDSIGREYPIVAPNVSLNSKIGIFTGCIDNLNKSVNSSYLHMRKVKSSEDLYIILAGTNTTYLMYDHIGYNGKSWYFSQDDAWGKYCVSDICEKIYEDLSGDKAKKIDKYDINLKLDKKHKGEIYSSIIYIDESGEIMEKAIIYSEDKVVLGKRKGFLDLGFEPIEDITNKFIDPRPASKQIYQLYNDMKGN